MCGGGGGGGYATIIMDVQSLVYVVKVITLICYYVNKDLFPDDHYHLSTGQCMKGCTAVGT